MKVLVIASEPISADRLRTALGNATDDAEVMVVAPALHRSALRFWLSDADDAIERAGPANARHDQSAGKRRSGQTRKGSKWLDWTLEESALAAVRSKDAYLAAQYTRLKPRRGHKKALGAVKHSIICACWHMLTTGELYRELGGDYYQCRDPARQTQRLIRQLEALGHTVTLQPTSTAETSTAEAVAAA